MIRRLNFTRRKKIPRKHVSIRLLPSRDRAYRFAATIELEGLELPARARVFVEAYRSNVFMRFPFGTVGTLIPPEDPCLDQFPEGVIPLFRVKVVGTGASEGLILAAVDQLRPLRPGEKPTVRLSLLPVEYQDLGQRVWALDLESVPVLILNKSLHHAAEVARSEPSFLALAYPEILRRVLHRVLIEEEVEDPAMDSGTWECQWLKFALGLKGVPSQPPTGSSEAAREAKLEWIEAAVGAFCEHHRVKDRLDDDLSVRRG